MILTSLLTDISRAPLDVFSARTPMILPLRGATAPARAVRTPNSVASLGTASASARWQWAAGASGERTSTVATTAAPRETAVRVPPLLLREMSEAARMRGRSLSDIWTEAAREWLAQHPHEDEPQPPTPAAAALAIPKPARSWAAIDAALADLRRAPHDVPAAIQRPAYIQEPPDTWAAPAPRSA